MVIHYVCIRGLWATFPQPLYDWRAPSGLTESYWIVPGTMEF